MSVSPEIAEGNGKCYSRNLPADVSKGLDWLYSFSGPALLHLMIDHKEQVMPMVGPGKSNSEPLRKK